MMRQEFDFLQILPAQPGFWVLEALPDESGAPYAFHRHAVVGWGLDRDFLMAFPITLEGPQDSRPILRPDGVIHVAFGGFHHSESELLFDMKKEWAAMRKGEAL